MGLTDYLLAVLPLTTDTLLSSVIVSRVICIRYGANTKRSILLSPQYSGTLWAREEWASVEGWSRTWGTRLSSPRSLSPPIAKV